MMFCIGDIVKVTVDCIKSGQVNRNLTVDNILKVVGYNDYEIYPYDCYCEELGIYEGFNDEELILKHRHVLNKADFL